VRLIRFLSLASMACALSIALPRAASAQQITVSAAAGLNDAFKEPAPPSEAAQPGTTVRLNFAASGARLQPIDQGAPAGVLASADQETMDRAADRQPTAPGTRRDLATSRLVPIEPAQGGTGIRMQQDLAGPAVRRIAVAGLPTAPVGRYARQALDAAGLRAALEPKSAQADSVRQVLDCVARGEADAGFVHRTDARMPGDRVAVVLEPPTAFRVSYPVAAAQDSRQPATARAFVEFLGIDAARRVPDRFGFGRP
jgi:molybdate transport system substrate-binding protein